MGVIYKMYEKINRYLIEVYNMTMARVKKNYYYSIIELEIGDVDHEVCKVLCVTNKPLSLIIYVILLRSI